MARKDINDTQIIAVCRDWRPYGVLPLDFLCFLTGQPWKVCLRAMERACDRGLIEYGTSIRSAWPTPKGLALLDKINKEAAVVLETLTPL